MVVNRDDGTVIGALPTTLVLDEMPTLPPNGLFSIPSAELQEIVYHPNGAQ